MRTRTLLCALVAVLLAWFVAGCGDSDPASPGSPGRLVVNLTDAPAEYDSVVVVVERVEVHRAGEDSASGWIVVSDTPAVYDLLQLRDGASAVLADHQLAPGQYTQLRLILGAGSRVVLDGAAHDLTVPSGLQTGIKLVHEFTIQENQLYEIVLDFDAARSVHRTGNGRYMLKPVIRCTWEEIAGAIRGTVLPPSARTAVWTVSGDDTVVAWADTLSGDYLLPVLAQGLYDLRFSPTDTAWLDTMLVGVPVVARQVTELDTLFLQAGPQP